MKQAGTLTEAAREEVRRVVLISRLAGAAVAIALAIATVYVNRADAGSRIAVAGYFTIAVGLFSYVVISTLARVGHARVLERTLVEVRSLTDQLHDLAERDPLTGLLNLRAFHPLVEGLLERSKAAGQSVSLIVADLDNFKVLNDSFGHQYGDAVLRATGDVFARHCRNSGFAARLGGDEFALVLPDTSGDEALRIAADLEADLRGVRLEGQAIEMVGSFGVGTFPADGQSVQALFAATDGRMYSEKHRRKAESLSSLAGAARKLFVRAGRAMRPDQTTTQILQEIAEATRDEFVLSVCAITIQARGHHPRVTVVGAAAPELEAACVEASAGGALNVEVMASLLPAETWLIETKVSDEGGADGSLILGGLPIRSFRPDAPVVVALADLLQAIVANGRAHIDALRAGRERDIHVDLAHALAGGGSLSERLGTVTTLINEFINASSVSIEALHPVTGEMPYNLTTRAQGSILDAWSEARATLEAQQFVHLIASEAPIIIDDPAHDERVPAAERRVLERAGIRSCAIAPIRFDGEALGLLGAVSDRPDFFDEEKMAVLLNIADHLAPAISAALLRNALEASYAELERESRESLARLADAAEARDPHTGGHLRRILHYSVELAREVGLPEEEARAIGAASALHDLGKMSLPDAVLMNPGKLTPEDWEQMHEHPQHGERLIGSSPKFSLERAVARWHHERWDGTGYPDGLAGEEIPLAARIVAVADAFDALTTDRPYKRAWGLRDAVAEVRQAGGTLFCPTVVGALDALWRRGRLLELFQAADDAEHAFDESRRNAA